MDLSLKLTGNIDNAKWHGCWIRAMSVGVRRLALRRRDRSAVRFTRRCLNYTQQRSAFFRGCVRHWYKWRSSNSGGRAVEKTPSDSQRPWKPRRKKTRL